MSTAQTPAVRKRVSILHRYFLYACDPTHPFQPSNLIEMRRRFATVAGVLRHTEEGDKFKQLTDACAGLPSDRIAAMYEKRFDASAMVQIAFPDRPRLFN